MKIIAKNGELELCEVSDGRGYVHNSTTGVDYPEMSIATILSRGDWTMIADKKKRVVVTLKQEVNLDKALFRDISGAANDAWIDAVWADMQKRYTPVNKEMKTVEPTSEDEDWMHKLPGYADEESL